MQAVLFDVHEAERVGCDFIVGRFAERAVDVQVGRCDGPCLYRGIGRHGV